MSERLSTSDWTQCSCPFKHAQQRALRPSLSARWTEEPTTQHTDQCACVCMSVYAWCGYLYVRVNLSVRVWLLLPCVCMSVCVNVHVWMYMCVCVCACMFGLVCVSTLWLPLSCMSVCVCVVWECLAWLPLSYVCMYVCMCVSVCMRACVFVLWLPLDSSISSTPRCPSAAAIISAVRPCLSTCSRGAPRSMITSSSSHRPATHDGQVTCHVAVPSQGPVFNHFLRLST